MTTPQARALSLEGLSEVGRVRGSGALRTLLLMAEVSTLSVSSFLTALLLPGVYPAVRTAMSRRLDTLLERFPGHAERRR